MKLIILVMTVVAFAATTCSAADLIFTTCARMNDGPVGAKVAQGLCIASCGLQNCGTGTCKMRGRPVCVCARCGDGGGLSPKPPKTKKKSEDKEDKD